MDNPFAYNPGVAKHPPESYSQCTYTPTPFAGAPKIFIRRRNFTSQGGEGRGGEGEGEGEGEKAC